MAQKNRHWILEEVKKLQIPLNECAVFGSGLLDVLSFKKAHDIDLLVTKRLFDTLAKNTEWKQCFYPDGHAGLKHKVKNIEAFYDAGWSGYDRVGVEEKIDHATIIDGVRFVSLQEILDWKRKIAREKDRRDVEIIEDYLLKRKKERSKQ